MSKNTTIILEAIPAAAVQQQQAQPVINVPTPMSVSSAHEVQSFDYLGLFTRAQDNDVRAITALKEHFTRQEALLRESYKKMVAQAQSRHYVPGDNADYAKFRHLVTCYQWLARKLGEVEVVAKKKGAKKATPEQWAIFADNGVTTRAYFGKLSFVDITSLIAGYSNKTPGSTSSNRRRGMQQLQFRGYGEVTCDAEGWYIEMDGQRHRVSGETLHHLLVHESVPGTSQAVPFDQQCVMPTVGWKANLNGHTVVLKENVNFVLEDNEKDAFIQLMGLTRLIMPRRYYAGLVWGVSALRYEGITDESIQAMSESNLTLFGETRGHVPENSIEFEYWFKYDWFSRKTPAQQEEYFKPGRALFGYTRESLRDFQLFQVAYAAEMTRRAKQAEQRQAAQAARRKEEEQAQQAAVVAEPTTVSMAVALEDLQDHPF